MCGIAGIWQLDGRAIDRSSAQRFIGALAHRGPDGDGVLFDDGGRLFLGHRRLAIIGLGADGAQPMRAIDGPFDITYNGEIYNFLEVRAELAAHGCRFRSDTDTEVVLAAFQHWGPDCLRRFNGMWSFAIWDRHRESLFLARDRFGVKPLYVCHTPARFVFASELKAFLRLDAFDAVADLDIVRARLADDFGDGVLLRGVDSVPAGYCLEVTRHGVRRWRWWNTLDHLGRVPATFAGQVEEFGALLADACRLRLRGDVSVATSLSGGLDSSAVVCTTADVQRHGGIARRPPDWRRAYIASFPDTAQDETRYAVAAAERAGAIPELRRFSGSDLAEDVDGYLAHFDEIGGLFGLGAWALYREMRRDGITVSLDGHGGDELLGGYGVHLLAALFRGPTLADAPGRAFDLFRTLRRVQPDVRLHAAVAALMAPGVRSLVPFFPPGRALARRIRQIIRDHSCGPATAESEDDRRRIDALGPLTGALYRSFHSRSLPRILRNFDVNSMAHGVEVRMPLLDWRLVCFAFATPDASKVAGGVTKRLLREAVRGLVPEPIRQRTDKVGYNAPVREWLGGGLADWAWDQVNDPEFLRSELWDGRALRDAVRTQRASGRQWIHEQAHRVLLAVSAHLWQTRWLSSGRAGAAQAGG